VGSVGTQKSGECLAKRPSRLRDLGLGGKLLLGSDFPNLPYPYAEQLAALVALDLGDAWLRAVCWQNAADLLNLPP